MTKVKFLKSHNQFAYFKGDVADIKSEDVATLLNSGYVIILPDERDDDVNTLPEDLPGREFLFDAGFDSIEKNKKAGNSLLNVTGIGKGTLKKIQVYLKDK